MPCLTKKSRHVFFLRHHGRCIQAASGLTNQLTAGKTNPTDLCASQHQGYTLNQVSIKLLKLCQQLPQGIQGIGLNTAQRAFSWEWEHQVEYGGIGCKESIHTHTHIHILNYCVFIHYILINRFNPMCTYKVYVYMYAVYILKSKPPFQLKLIKHTYVRFMKPAPRGASPKRIANSSVT